LLDWRPVDDIQHRTRQIEIEPLESEKCLKLLKNETELLKNENKRLAALESRLDALLLNADSSSQTPPATGSS
jgi:hypothetical protein